MSTLYHRYQRTDEARRKMSQDPKQLIECMASFVTACMGNHDPSHNPAHVHRVVSLAQSILRAEQSLFPEKKYDSTVVTLAALLHDIGDRKYLSNVTGFGSDASVQLNPNKMVEHVLLKHGADPLLAERVQTIVSHVSFTTECADPDRVARLIATEGEHGYAELAIVQDADRLDALGAIGIGRTFTFLGAQGRKMVPEGGVWEMDNSIRHFGEKLERLEGMMKTQTGREMAKLRTDRLRQFRGWWEEEMDLARES
ncbi:hypothetical protein ASPZODRAFT_131514 [Penicilliopsis zonata CBS 506.65]|uniref:HD/PDEase domain-containing protein n=1 Tax=Penicilliopsis zonata CBS 506.65 TaxID=1073090 RepID=A0A1L9SL15_9EURO|nr:hypothetical protein ASPZODRAFT_131514 [Penicilliopsis zonata CBS 506.65]OJJ47909.1 hypothetical protein ASPZODRAFT_131514 [Penicilliopsis zonata CBS 506.65]